MNPETIPVVSFLELIVLGLLLSRIVIYSQKTPSNYYYGLVATVVWLHLAYQQAEVRSGLDWCLPAGFLLVANVWISVRRFHQVYWERIRPRYHRVVTSVAV